MVVMASPYVGSCGLGVCVGVWARWGWYLHGVCTCYRSISCRPKFMKNVKFTCGAG